MAIANTGAFGNSLDGDMNGIFFDEYEPYARDFESVAVIETAPPGNHYQESELSGFGHLVTKDEGDRVTFDLPEQGHAKTIYYTSYAKGFQITSEMYKDDLFQNFMKLPAKLAKSAAIKPDVVFFDTVFNNGFDTTTGWDGQYVFDNDHDQLYTGNSSKSNIPTTAGSLSETTLQAAYEYYWDLEDEAGLPIQLTPDMLLAPPELTWVVEKLRQSGLVVGSGNNDINTVNPGNSVVSWTPFISRFLTDANAWFLLAEERDCRLYWKENAQMESADDFHTGNALFKVTMRFSAFVMDWKGMYGNAGPS
jgi:hypothetical protein